MRIISPFRDYYDIGMTFGIDPKIVYVRKQRKIKLNERLLPWNGRLSVLGVCGEIIPFVDYRRMNDRLRGSKWVLYGADVINKRMYPSHKWITIKGGRTLRKDTSKLADTEEDWQRTRARRDIERLNRDAFVALFTEFRTPLWIVETSDRVHDATLILNPRLTDIYFQRQRSAQQIFQQISQFISNMHAPEQAPPVAIEDKLRLTQHGYDEKISFRKRTHQSKPRGQRGKD